MYIFQIKVWLVTCLAKLFAQHFVLLLSSSMKSVLDVKIVSTIYMQLDIWFDLGWNFLSKNINTRNKAQYIQPYILVSNLVLMSFTKPISFKPIEEKVMQGKRVNIVGLISVYFSGVSYFNATFKKLWFFNRSWWDLLSQVGEFVFQYHNDSEQRCYRLPENKVKKLWSKDLVTLYLW